MRIRIPILALGALALSLGSCSESRRGSAPAADDSTWVAVQQKVDEVTARLASYERADHTTEAPGLRIDWEIYFSDDEVVCIIEKADMNAEGSGEITHVFDGEQLISRAGWEHMKLAEKPGGGLHDIHSRLLFDQGWAVLQERTIDDEPLTFEDWQVDALQQQSEDLLARLKREVKDER